MWSQNFVQPPYQLKCSSNLVQLSRNLVQVVLKPYITTHSTKVILKSSSSGPETLYNHSFNWSDPEILYKWSWNLVQPLFKQKRSWNLAQVVPHKWSQNLMHSWNLVQEVLKPCTTSHSNQLLLKSCTCSPETLYNHFSSSSGPEIL